MRKLYIVGLVAVAALVIGIAIADEIKFSTYYPAPYGKYREFDTTGKTCLATDEWGIEGTNARVGIGTTDPGTAKLAVIGGNVGIGTTDPSEKLVSNVSGVGVITGLVLNNQHGYGVGAGTAATRLSFGRDPAGTGQTIISSAIDGGNEHEQTSNPGYMAFSTKSGGIPYLLTERMRIDSHGNVGIGTTEPGNKLELYGSGHEKILVTSTGTNHAVGIQMTQALGDAAQQIWQWQTIVGTGKIQLRDATDHRSVIVADGDGNVGINETNPSARLYVDGNIKYTGSCTQADYVFEPDYKLESIEAHAKLMWKSKHLPGILQPEKTEEGKDIIELGEDRRGLLEELEKAHIYIEQLNQRMKSLEAKIRD